MEVLELKDIDRDFQVVCARLKLANKTKSFPGGGHVVSGPAAPASETVAFLVGANLYEDAVRIASAFDPALDVRPIVEGLAAKCVMLARLVHFQTCTFDLQSEGVTKFAKSIKISSCREYLWVVYFKVQSWSFSALVRNLI